jgi:hypothetical protein
MSRKWSAVCVDAGDGSGDLIVDLQSELLSEMGWSVGDSLFFDIQPDQTIRLSKSELADLERDQPLEGQECESFD